MARDFDGAGDNVNFGSDASIDDFALKSVCAWIRAERGPGAADTILNKTDGGAVAPTGWGFRWDRGAVGDTGHLFFFQDFSVTDGNWVTANNSVPVNEHHAVAVTYDRGATGNDPNIYIDSTLQTETETLPPAGASNADAAQNLRTGENDGGGADFDGQIGWIVYDDTILTALDVNRHRWHGRAPGGPSTVNVWHPFVTNDLTNKGTATANGTATGTTVVAFPKVSRL